MNPGKGGKRFEENYKKSKINGDQKEDTSICSLSLFLSLSLSLSQAYHLIKEMQQCIPSVNLSYYISNKTIETTHSAMGVPLRQGEGSEGVRAGRGGGKGGEGEESEEESVGEEEEVEEA